MICRGLGEGTTAKPRAGVLVLALLVASALVGVSSAAAYTPKPTDSFNYSETITVNDGQGSYTGYTDHTSVTGTETVKSITGTNVSMHYMNSYSFSNNQGSSFSNSSSGDFTWSASIFTYVNGTDNQVGYSKPTYVWFAMNPAVPLDGTFYALNTQLTLMSRNYSFQLLGNGSRWVQTLWAEGKGQYQRHDSYGTFTASFTWDEYFDLATGYIVGYHYVEQDNGEYQGQPGSFAYVDDLYVTSTSYGLAAANPGNTSTQSNTGLGLELISLGVAGVLVLIAVGIYAMTRRRRSGSSLPQHSAPPPSQPSSAPWQSGIDLGSKPPQEVVIRDVAKVNCRYCGTLIPTTADTCPYCGGPRR